MDAITFVAERKIEQALEEGQFDNLPGAGKPLHLEDLSRLPPEARMAYIILKNSGHIEKPLDTGHILNTRELLESCPEESGTYGKIQRLKVMLGRVRRSRGATSADDPADIAGPEAVDSPYLEKLIRHV